MLDIPPKKKSMRFQEIPEKTSDSRKSHVLNPIPDGRNCQKASQEAKTPASVSSFTLSSWLRFSEHFFGGDV
jgi:hypothetical protein